MASENGLRVLTDAQWEVLEPLVLVLAVRPAAKTPHEELRCTMSAILWRCRNGTGRRAIPAGLGQWWKAAQTFIRWGKKSVWERLLALAQEQEHAGGVELGMAFLDGTNIRAHAKAAGTAKKGSGAPKTSLPRAAIWRSTNQLSRRSIISGRGSQATWFGSGPGGCIPHVLLPRPAKPKVNQDFGAMAASRTAKPVIVPVRLSLDLAEVWVVGQGAEAF